MQTKRSNGVVERWSNAAGQHSNTPLLHHSAALMALQDLTPQLRTRLSRMERAVGWFVALAMALLAFGFVYYVYHTAESKGWFLTKAPYYTYTDRATGLKVGDPVMLMGLAVGQITRMEPMPPEEFHHNIYVEFEIKDPYYGYLWTEGSRAKVATADLLGKRVLEVTKGTGGYPTYVFNPLREVSIAEARSLADSSNWLLAQEVWDQTGTNLVAKAKTPLTNLTALAAAGCTNLLIMNTSEQRKLMTGIWNDQEGRYDAYTRKSKYELLPDESAAVTERLEKLVGEVEQALPNILALTNQLVDGALQQRQPDFEPERRGPRRAAGRQQPDDAHRAVGPARRARGMAAAHQYQPSARGHARRAANADPRPAPTRT